MAINNPTFQESSKIFPKTLTERPVNTPPPLAALFLIILSHLRMVDMDE
jgi:hypothetical protein